MYRDRDLDEAAPPPPLKQSNGSVDPGRIGGHHEHDSRGEAGSRALFSLFPLAAAVISPCQHKVAQGTCTLVAGRELHRQHRGDSRRGLFGAPTLDD